LRTPSTLLGKQWDIESSQLSNQHFSVMDSISIHGKGHANCPRIVASQSSTTVQREGRCMRKATISTTCSCSNCSTGVATSAVCPSTRPFVSPTGLLPRSSTWCHCAREERTPGTTWCLLMPSVTSRRATHFQDILSVSQMLDTMPTMWYH
jgi:hypothetical protein